jgi:hypothetical protein
LVLLVLDNKVFNLDFAAFKLIEAIVLSAFIFPNGEPGGTPTNTLKSSTIVDKLLKISLKRLTVSCPNKMGCVFVSSLSPK